MSQTASRKQSWLRVTQIAVAASAFALLAACGGGSDNNNASSTPAGGVKLQVVSFGDSLSDVGTYAPVIQSSFGGGRFTTNPGEVWTQKVAEYYGGTLTAAYLGGFGQPLTATGGLGYAQGGSDVVNAQGQGWAPNNMAATTVPVVTQVANYLSAHQSFNANQLVLVNGGANDIFQFAGTTANLVALGTALQTQYPLLVQAGKLPNSQAGQVAFIIGYLQQLSNPQITTAAVHLAPQGDPGYWVEEMPADAQRLIDAFWPGPLTLILKRAAHINPAVSGGQDSVGLRCPSHPVAQALLQAFSALRGGHGGVAAPSANRFGHVSPTTAQHVREEFGSAIHVLDGGASDVGIESTILDLSRGFPALLRPGRVTPQDIADVLGESPRLPDGSDATAPRASGTLKAHYAPRTPLALLPFGALEPLLAAREPGERVALVARASRAGSWAEAEGVHFIAAPEDPHLYARELYGLLRALDRANVSRILIEKLPDTIEWIAVNDRLGRAAAAFEARG